MSEEEKKDLEGAGAPEGEQAGDKGNTDNERLLRLERELEDSKRKITDLANDKAVLEKRFEDIQRPAKPEGQTEPELESSLKEALDEASINPENAAKKLASTLSKTRDRDKQAAIQEAIRQVDEQNRRQQEVVKYADEVKAKKPHLSKYEARLAKDAAGHMERGMNWRQAIDKAVDEFERDFPDLTKSAQPQAPKSALGEGAGGGPSEKQAPKKSDDAGDTPEDYVAERKRLVSQRGA